MNALKLNSICKSFADINIFNNVNLEIERGKTACLLGPSGCGKSSLLYIASGILKQDSGMVEAMGMQLKTEQDILNARRQFFGFIFQFHNLIGELTVMENLTLAQSICGKQDKTFAEHLLSKLGLLEKRNFSVHVLSGGEAQRVAIARAFAVKPAIVFADEPTGNLDPETGQKAISLILNLTKTFNATLLTVTHNYDFAKKFEKCFEIVNHKVNEKML